VDGVRGQAVFGREFDHLWHRYACQYRQLRGNVPYLFQVLETFDESFYAPDYDGTFDQARWPICGIGLPKEVLKKIYHGNILKIIPSPFALHAPVSILAR
jgi:hypothetical protein